MTHGQIIKYRTGKKSQYGNQLAEGIRLCFRGGKRFVNPMWNIQAPGIPLCQGGRSCWPTGASARPEDCLHGEVVRKSLTGITAIRSIQGSNVKRSGHRGPEGLALQRLETWSDRGKRKDPLSWSIVLTDCHHVRSAKRTSFSCLKKDGVSALDIIL
jgi:hypothetical protein